MKKYFQNISLTNIFGIALFLFAVIPVTALVINFYYLYSQRATDDIQDKLISFEQELGRLMQNNQSYLDDQLQALTNNRSVLFALKTKSESDLQDMGSDYLSKTSISQVDFFDETDEKIIGIAKVEGKIGTTSASETLENENGLAINLIQQPALILSKEIYDNNQKVGRITQAIEIPLPKWYEMAYSQGVDLFLFKENRELLYATVDNIKGESTSLLEAFKKDFSEVGVKENTFTMKSINNPRLPILLGVNHQFYQRQLNTVTLATGLTLVLVLIVLIPLLVLLSRWILSPLHHVTNAIVQVSEGENPQPIKPGFGKEVGLLTNSFNMMTTKLQEARKALQGKIQELQSANKKIQDAQASLVHNAKMASLGQLVAGVAHELNNPIGFINSNMDYLEKQVADLTSLIEDSKDKNVEKWKTDNDWDFLKKDLLKAIQACKDGASRTSVIVQDLRMFSRLDKGQKDFVYIEDLIENTLKLLKNNVGPNIELQTHLRRESKVHCNPNQINQVLVNLIMNGLQAISEKGRISISTKNHDEKFYEIEISDTGIGMPKDVQERVFEPFYTTKEVGKGTGLGLSITYNIIKEHGGSIHLSSQINQGTSFTILLPRA